MKSGSVNAHSKSKSQNWLTPMKKYSAICTKIATMSHWLTSTR